MAPDAFDEDDDARAALDEEAAASTPASVWLEESSRARAWANLLSPGLPRHRDALGDGLAPRPEVRARLRAHVSSLGPPHTLVLTGPEGSGKTTELAVLADWLRRGGREDPRADDRFDDDAARDGAPGGRARPPPELETGTGTREAPETPSGSSESYQHDGEPPFVLAHTFADASFPQDTAHFLEKACARLKRAFGIAAPLPRDAADLPECFARFLETAALHRRVVVIVDACESARCAPYAGVGAVAVAGLDPRENAPAEFFFEEEERQQKRVSRASSNDDASSVEGAHDSCAFSTSNAHLVDLREHFKWLPQSPPLAVRFVLACREDASSREGEAETENASAVGVARAIQSGAPASRASYAMPPLTVEQTRAVLASATPAPLGEPNKDGAFKNSASALERGHHHCLETAAVVNAAERNGATPLFARVASPFVAGLCAATKHGAWIAAGGEATATNEEDEFSGVFGEDLRSGSESGGGGEKERRAERVVVPPAVAAAVRASAGTAFGLVHGRLGAFERRADLEPRTLRAVCLAFAVARFGVTEREARRLARRIVDEETARRNAAFPDSPSASPFADDAFDAALRALRPWLAPWTTRASWAAERVPFEGDEDLYDAESFDRKSAIETKKGSRAEAEDEASREKNALLSGERGSDGRDSAGAEDDDDVPLTFRDAPTRACVLRRYAPPHARSALDGESVRRRLHADVAAFFLEGLGNAGEEEMDKVEKKKKRVRPVLSRRLTRAAAWHCSAAEDYASLSALVGGSPGAVAAFARPGLRSELAVLLANGAGSAPSPSASLVTAAVAERARAWLDKTEEDEISSTIANASLSETETDLSAVRERSRRVAAHSGRYAGCCLALASVFCWLKTPESAAAALAAATERFGPPRGRSGVTCALALGRCEALCLMMSRSKRRRFERFFEGASRFDGGDAFFFGDGGADGADDDDVLGAADDDDARPTVDVDGRATRVDSALPKLAKEAFAACETFAAASSGDFSGVFPSPWRETLFECSAFGSALRSPPTLAALAASLRVDVVSRFHEAGPGAVGGKDSFGVEKEKTLTLFDARLEEIRAWRRAALATATPRVSRALTTVLDRGSTTDSLLASRVSDTAARGLSFEREEDASTAFERSAFAKERVSLVSPSAEVLGLLDALRARRDAFDPRSSPEDARDASDVLVAVLAALLGDNHPETGAAKTVAAEAAARAVVDGGFGGFEEDMFGEDGEDVDDDVKKQDHYSSQIATLIAWSKPAYAFAERFYGARSLPAARAAWCVAEGVRRRADGADGAYFGDGASTRRSSAKFGRVSAGGAGARAARPMYAQALGATVATLGPAHEGAGETFIAAGALSRSERRAEEARALIEEGARVARSNAAAAEAERDALVAAGFEALEGFSLKNAHRDVLERVRLGSETCVAAAERRLRFAERRAGRGFAKLSLLARDDGDASGAELSLRRALACFERALGPGCGACAPLLAALGRVATDRGNAETAEACFRHALGVDEAAARKTFFDATRDGHSVSSLTFSLLNVNVVFAHPRSASHLASIAWSRARAKGSSQAEVLLHAALDAAASAAAVPPAARDALFFLTEAEAADDADDERASLARAASDPGEILNRLGLMYSHQGRFEEAAQRFERAVALGAARARAAARDADALNAEATFLHSRGSPASPTFDETSQRKRKIDRRTRLVASADAARRWRDASALTSAALANLGVLRFRTSSARDVARGGGCASFFHRAWTYAANNPDLGPSHPHTAWAHKWFEVSGGSASVASDAGRAVDSMLDATLRGEWGGFNVRSTRSSAPEKEKADPGTGGATGSPAFRDGFETAWGALAGETSAAIADGGRADAGLSVEPCAVANDATPRKVPVLAELGSFAEPRPRRGLGSGSGSGAFSFREKTSARDGDGFFAKTKTKTLASRPAVSVTLEHHRPASVAIASWRLFWSEADVAHAVRLDHLDVDLALAAVVDDVANGAVGKLSETVFTSSDATRFVIRGDGVDGVRESERREKRRDEARAKAFAAAALSAARAAANASSFLFDDSVWARRCDGGDGRTLDARLGETGTRRDGDGDGDGDAFEDERRAVDEKDSVSVRGDGDPGDGDPGDGDPGDSDSSVEDGVPGGTDASARLAADVPADPADSALVAQSFVVALHAETEAEKAANPENEFLEHYRARLAARLMRSKEESEWEATKTRVQNASSRETMALIVRDGDLVGMAEAIGVVEGDDDANRNRNRREIVSTRVSSIAGTRTAVDAARAFFVDSSAEAGPHGTREKNARNGKGKEKEDDDDDGRLEEPFLWAPGEAERAAARKMALEDARHAAAVARDEARREMLTAQRESLARGALRRSGGKRTSATETERARASVDRHDSGARTAEAARAAVEAASFAVRVAAEALESGGDVASRADAVAAATRAARDFALARSSRDGARSSRPSTASKLEAFKRRRSRDAEKETRPGTARSPPFANGHATRDENDDVVTSDGGLDLEKKPSRFFSRDDDAFSYAFSPPENLARASSSAYGVYANGSAPPPSASPFVGRGRTNEFYTNDSRGVDAGTADVARRVSIPRRSHVSARSDDVVSVPVSRLLSWVDRGLAVRDSAGLRGSGSRESTSEALPRWPADREGIGRPSSARPRLADSDGETFNAEDAEEGDASVFAKESASGDVRVAPRGSHDFDARDFTDVRASSKIGAMLAEERAFRTHNASARLLADLSAARGARRLRESVDATPKSNAFFSAAKSNASRARPASAAAATAAAAEPRRPTLASRRPSSAAGFAADAPEDERVWKARMRARVEERRRKLFGVGGGTK